MRYIITILFVSFWQVTFCQKMGVYSLQGFPTAVWTTDDETSVMNYEVQDSVPGKSWVSLKNTNGSVIEIPKGQSSYSYQLPAISASWRIKAVGVTNFYTNAIYVPTNNVTITVPVFHTTSLTWKTATEINVSYYLIQKTRNNSTTQVSKVTAKGSGNYTYRMNKTVNKYTYKITPVFRDGTAGAGINFK